MRAKLPPNEYVDGRCGKEAVHRVAYEQAFGFVGTWHVHHVNRLKYDNRLENLIALPTKFHRWLHRDPVRYALEVERGNVTKDVLERLLVSYLKKEFALVFLFKNRLAVLSKSELSQEDRALIAKRIAEDWAAHLEEEAYKNARAEHAAEKNRREALVSRALIRIEEEEAARILNLRRRGLAKRKRPTRN